MAKPFADGDNAHAAVDQCSRMTVAELVQATRDPCFDTITCPPFLNGLIAQGGATTVFFSAKQRAMPIAARCQVHFELMDQTWIIQQNGDICNTPRKGKLEQINGITRPSRKVAKSTAITSCDPIDLRSLWEINFQVYLSEGNCKEPLVKVDSTPVNDERQSPAQCVFASNGAKGLGKKDFPNDL